MLDQVDRAVLATGAANGHRHVTAVIARQRFQPVIQEAMNLLLHLHHVRLGPQEGSNRFVLAGQVPQRGFVVRIGQHAHIEDVVGVGRYTALEGKGLEHQGELLARRCNQRFHVALQLRGADDAGVNDVRLITQRDQQLAFGFNRINQGPAQVGVRRIGDGLRKRVFATRLGITPHQGIGGGVQKQRLDLDALILQQRELRWQQRQGAGVARIHRNRDPACIVLALQRHKRQQQFGRQVVDAEKARILQRMQRHGFAGARHTCDQNDLQLGRFNMHQLAPVLATFPGRAPASSPKPARHRACAPPRPRAARSVRW